MINLYGYLLNIAIQENDMTTTSVPQNHGVNSQEGFLAASFHLSPRNITRILSLVLGGLTIASIAGQVARYIWGYATLGGIILLFDLDEESNVPTWYSATMLLLCAMFLGVIAAAKKKDRDSYAWHWQILAIIFLGLSLDETAGLHEMTIIPLRSMLRASGVLRFTWVVLGAAFVLIFIVAYLRFFMKLPQKTRWLFALGGTLYVGGALGMELIGGYYASLHGQENLTFAMLSTIEEVGEMAGVLTFMYALMSYISTYIREVKIYISNHGPRSPA
jgi:hypothetical protein